MASLSNGNEVKLGRLVELYEGMGAKGLSQEVRLRQAEELSNHPEQIAEMFEADHEQLDPLDYKMAPFHSGAEDRDDKAFAPKSKTRVVAQSLITMIGKETVEVAGSPELNFVYLDREIVTARAPGATFRSQNGELRSSRSLPKLDLLLANADDGTPIVAELKVGDDRDPFYALIQALAHAAMLSTRNQLDRLHHQYEHAIAKDSEKVDVYVVLVGSATGSNWSEFDRLARKLASGLLEIGSFSSRVRNVEQVKLSVEGSSLR